MLTDSGGPNSRGPSAFAEWKTIPSLSVPSSSMNVPFNLFSVNLSPPTTLDPFSLGLSLQHLGLALSPPGALGLPFFLTPVETPAASAFPGAPSVPQPVPQPQPLAQPEQRGASADLQLSPAASRPASLDLPVKPRTHKRKASHSSPAASPEGGPIHAMPRARTREPSSQGAAPVDRPPAPFYPAVFPAAPARQIRGFVPSEAMEDEDEEERAEGAEFASYHKVLDYKSCESILCLTKEMARELLPLPPPGTPSFQTTVVLVDPNGLEWPVTYRCVPNRYSYEFRSGWKNFAAHWRISTGDTVLLQRKGSRRDRILITLMRHGADPSTTRLAGRLEQELLRAVDFLLDPAVTAAVEEGDGGPSVPSSSEERPAAPTEAE